MPYQQSQYVHLFEQRMNNGSFSSSSSSKRYRSLPQSRSITFDRINTNTSNRTRLNSSRLIIASTFLVSLFGSVLVILWDVRNSSNHNGHYSFHQHSTMNHDENDTNNIRYLHSITSTLGTIGVRQTQQDIDTTTNTTNCDEIVQDDGGWVNSIPKPLQYTLITVLILFSAFFSGLTLSMMGLDTTGLEIVMSGDDPVLSRAAGKIYPVRKNGNLLLCTLLLGNVAVNTLLGILMADITGGTVGFITSTALIVIFGEIIPQVSVFCVLCFWF